MEENRKILEIWVLGSWKYLLLKTNWGAWKRLSEKYPARALIEQKSLIKFKLSRRRPVYPLHQGPYNRTRWGGRARRRRQGLCGLLPRAGLSALLGTSGPLPRGPTELQVHNKALMAPPTWTLCHTWPPLLGDHFRFDFLLLLLLGAVTVLGERASIS